MEKSSPPELVVWNAYKIAAKLTWVGIVVAPDEQSAIEAAAKEFTLPANRLKLTARLRLHVLAPRSGGRVGNIPSDWVRE
jgi:hypothetical protein